MMSTFYRYNPYDSNSGPDNQNRNGSPGLKDDIAWDRGCFLKFNLSFLEKFKLSLFSLCLSKRS